MTDATLNRNALALFAAALLALTGCTTITRPNASAPLITPPSGAYTGPLTVTISDTNTSAVLHVTTDGTTPTPQSPLYTAPLSLTADATVSAVATYDGQVIGTVTTAIYTVAPPPTATPVFNPPGGTYSTAPSVTITDATPYAAIFYTVDGSQPTTLSFLYTGPITVSQSETINATAFASGHANSATASATYTINAGLGLWTWFGGGRLLPAYSYGTLGVPAATNWPPPHDSASTWTDHNGNLWMFGGSATINSTTACAQDLWEYTPSTGLWTWQGGSQTADVTSVHGTSGAFDPSFHPGARGAGFNWTDPAGYLWMFGGDCIVSTNSGNQLYTFNEVWKFDVNLKQWAWIRGDTAQQPTGVYGVLGTPDPANTPGGRERGASFYDAAGNFLLYGGQGYGATPTTGELGDLWSYSPSTNQWTWLGGSQTVYSPAVYGTQGTTDPANTPGGLTNEVAFTTPSHQVFLFSGDGWRGFTTAPELSTLWSLSLPSDQWTWTSGSITAPAAGTFGSKGVASASNSPPGRNTAYGWTALDGTLWAFGGNETSGSSSESANDLWKFDPATNLWTWMNGSSSTGAASIFGQIGIAAPSNVPGARQGGVTWVDPSGAFWLFGGTETKNNNINELWRYQP